MNKINCDKCGGKNSVIVDINHDEAIMTKVCLNCQDKEVIVKPKISHTHAFIENMMEAVEYNCERYRSMSGECPMCNCLLYSEASLAEGYANKVKTFENSMTSGNSVEALKAASDLIMTIIMLSINKISTEPN